MNNGIIVDVDVTMGYKHIVIHDSCVRNVRKKWKVVQFTGMIEAFDAVRAPLETHVGCNEQKETWKHGSGR